MLTEWMLGPDCFELYEDGAFLCSFLRSSFRESLSALGRSSNWIGSILRLFLKKFPAPYPAYSQSAFERAVSIYGESGLAGYLRSKGFKVVKPIAVSDYEIIEYLESQGYVIAGLLDNIYYETEIKVNSQVKNKVEIVGGSYVV